MSLLEIAAAESSVKAGDIAAVHGIPGSYLNNVLFELRRLGHVTSKKGANGGYRLARPPEEINLLRLHQGLAGAAGLGREVQTSGALLWLQELENRWLSELERTYLSDLQAEIAIERSKSQEESKLPKDFLASEELGQRQLPGPEPNEGAEEGSE